MSDGGISLNYACGWDGIEFSCDVFVKPNWYRTLDDERIRRDRAIYEAAQRIWFRPVGIKQDPEPHKPDLPEIEQIIGAALGDKDIVPGWYCNTEPIINALHRWNQTVDRVWKYQLGMCAEETKKARPSNKNGRKKLGYTEKLTPGAWLKRRGLFKKYDISNSVWTHEIWQERTTLFLEFLTEGKLENEYMFLPKAGIPKLSWRHAKNVFWYLSAIGMVQFDEIDVCDECGKVLMTDRETHDWCQKCGVMRCESCTTAPDYCQCDHACGKHCTCKDE